MRLETTKLDLWACHMHAKRFGQFNKQRILTHVHILRTYCQLTVAASNMRQVSRMKYFSVLCLEQPELLFSATPFDLPMHHLTAVLDTRF